jgi:hypothetical protein
MNYEREHALLLMMEGQQTWKINSRISDQCMAVGLPSPFRVPRTCRFEPGRRHLPAEFGGRIAVECEPEIPMRAAPGNLLRPLEFDQATLTYTGTILWDFTPHAQPESL